MSSSGITPVNSGPLIIRSYNDISSRKTYLVTDYDIPVSSNYILTTSTAGLLVPSNNIYVSSITVSSINGLSYPPADDAFWSGDGSGNIYNDNPGNVGIGVATPQFKLDVLGEGHFSTSGGVILLNPDGTGGNEIRFGGGGPNADNLRFVGSGETERVRIDPNGNVGIGISTPQFKLDVLGEGHFSTSGGVILLNPDGTGGNEIRFGGGGPNADNLRFVGSGETERMRIDPNGNVGIGISTPQFKLDVDGVTQISGGGANFRFGTSIVNEGFSMSWDTIQASGLAAQTELISGRGYSGNSESGGFDFFTDVSDNTDASGSNLAVRITGDKKVGINTSVPAYTLDVAGIAQVSTLKTDIVDMTNGQIAGLSTINGSAYPPLGYSPTIIVQSWLNLPISSPPLNGSSSYAFPLLTGSINTGSNYLFTINFSLKVVSSSGGNVYLRILFTNSGGLPPASQFIILSTTDTLLSPPPGNTYSMSAVIPSGGYDTYAVDINTLGGGILILICDIYNFTIQKIP